MKNKKSLIIVSILTLVLILGGTMSVMADDITKIAPTDIPTKGIPMISERTITVSGEAEVAATPNICYISLGVRTEDKDPKVAQQENAKKMDAVMEQLTTLKIETKNIKTTNYNIYPQYGYEQATGKSFVNGYVVENSVSVKLTDINNVGKVIDAVTANGANIINNISFDVSNKETLYNEALKLAVAKTKDKALIMADVFGSKNVVPKSISENSSYNAPIYNYAMYKSEAMADGVGTPVSAGEIKIKANVSAVYSY